MQFRAILNRQGGTLRTMDLEAFSARLRDILAASGHTADVVLVDGDGVVDALVAAAADTTVDAVIAGGGDGTVSAAAAALKDTGKPLAILPAGTMNLFARSLAVPLDMEQALQAFAGGETRDVDVASANGKVFVHQYSVGLHAKLVTMREKLDFGSRLGKIRASIRAAIDTFVRPPSMRVRLVMGDTVIEARTSGVGVTNNLFGEGHLPYADNPAGGTLGVYVTVSRSRWQLFVFVLNMLVGRWKRNPQVEIHQTREVELSFTRVHARHRCVIDGELAKLENPTTIRIHAGALRVLAPAREPATARATAAAQ